MPPGAAGGHCEQLPRDPGAYPGSGTGRTCDGQMLDGQMLDGQMLDGECADAEDRDHRDSWAR